ncbi:MAG: flavin reductase family protein [Longimicrobiales bacterium]
MLDRRPDWTGTPYPLLRHLTLPVVAVTTSAEGQRNGMIANSAQRASLVPSIPRVTLYISKTNRSHDLVYTSGLLAVHLLRQDQWELIWRLGLVSGRDADKLAGLEVRQGDTGCPYLTDCIAAFECHVSNAMDAGAATFFLADVVTVHEGTAGPVMTSTFFREHMPPDRKRQYEDRLAAAQETLAAMASSVSRKSWPGVTAQT